MGEAARSVRRRFTWDDYRGWPDDERWEIIEGEAYAMSPSPTSRHQLILVALASALHRRIRKAPCRALIAPMDVKLSDEDVVQPDALVVCDPRQIKRTHVEGAPTVVVEILSEHSILHDRARKNRLYARAGVPEYWIITPFPSVVEVFSLDGDTYRLRHVFGKQDTLTSPALPGLRIKLADIFDFPPEPGEEPPAVREPRPRYKARAQGKG